MEFREFSEQNRYRVSPIRWMIFEFFPCLYDTLPTHVSTQVVWHMKFSHVSTQCHTVSTHVRPSCHGVSTHVRNVCHSVSTHVRPSCQCRFRKHPIGRLLVARIDLLMKGNIPDLLQQHLQHYIFISTKNLVFYKKIPTLT